jgi:SAM-dependent methyltransferase
MRFLLFFVFALSALGVGAQSWAWDDGTTPFVVSPDEVVDRMLRLAEPKAGERLIDLGSGDGRIVIEAAKRFGTRGLGVDIDPALVALARERAQEAGVAALTRFEVQDLFETDLRGASVITTYLLPEVNRKLVPRLLEQLKPGARIVSHDYDLGAWPFDEMIELPLADKMVGPMGRSRIFLWIVPENARGKWRFELPEHGGRWEIDVTQQYQVLDASARAGAAQMTVRGARLRGNEIGLAITGLVAGRAWNQQFKGRVADGRIQGEVTVSDGLTRRTLPWTATRAQ